MLHGSIYMTLRNIYRDGEQINDYQVLGMGVEGVDVI